MSIFDFKNLDIEVDWKALIVGVCGLMVSLICQLIIKFFTWLIDKTIELSHFQTQKMVEKMIAPLAADIAEIKVILEKNNG